MQVKCIVAETKNRVAVQDHPLREPRADELVAETLFSAISPGTELRCLAGNERNAGAFPMITGYSLVARVTQAAGDFHNGDVAFFNGTPLCPEAVSRSWGGHISHVVAPPSAALKLPAGVDLRCASALAMLTVAMHGVCRTAPLPGDRVLVAGQGLIGLAAAAYLRLAGCRVAVCDAVAFRLELARKLGIEHTFEPSQLNRATLQEALGGDVDILVDATGLPKVVTANAALLREKSWVNPYEPSPKLVLLASYPGEIAIDYQETLFNKETEIVTCRNILPHEPDRVLRLLAARTPDFTPLVAEVVSVREAPEAFRLLREEPQKHVTFVIDWTK